MEKRKPRINPFYLLLVITGVAFVITVCAMGVVTVKETRASQSLVTVPISAGEQRFSEIVSRYAMKAIVVELGILAVCTVAAVGTDRYWIGP